MTNIRTFPDLDSNEETFQIIALGEDAKAFLTTPFGHYMMDRAQLAANTALDQLKSADPTDTKVIMTLQNDIRRYEEMQAWIKETVQAADLEFQRYQEQQSEE